VLSGFDRLVFRGTLLPLVHDGEKFFFLDRAGVRQIAKRVLAERPIDRGLICVLTAVEHPNQLRGRDTAARPHQLLHPVVLRRFTDMGPGRVPR
jgi:hypothetical protein